MTTKTTKMLILTAVLTMVIIPGSVYAGSFNEHQVEKASGDIGKVASSTFDEKVAKDRLKYLMTAQMETGVSHEKEITEIETEYQKLYEMDANIREEYQGLTDILSEKMVVHHADKQRSVEERMNELPIIGVGVDGKSKSIQVTLQKKYVTEADLPEWKTKIQKMISRNDVDITLRLSSGITFDTHTSNRENTTVDPLKGGASVGFVDGGVRVVCTAGYMATENGSGDKGFVSAGHCTEASGYGQTGNDITQPVASSTNVIATVDEEDFSSSTYCDCSFNEFETGESGTPVTMYSLTSNFPVYSQYTITSSSEGLAVYMSGATSGYEVGVIDDYIHTIYIEDDDATLKNVFVSTYDAASGDSGAPVMRLNGIAGIHVASDDDFSYGVTVSRTNSYLGVTPDFS